MAGQKPQNLPSGSWAACDIWGFVSVVKPAVDLQRDFAAGVSSRSYAYEPNSFSRVSCVTYQNHQKLKQPEIDIATSHLAILHRCCDPNSQRNLLRLERSLDEAESRECELKMRVANSIRTV